MRNPCCDRKDVNRGAWSRQEDQKLIDFVQAHGEGCWRSLPRQAGLLRCGNSCRLRWINYLKPDVKRGNFSDDEEDLIIKLHSLLGNRWSLIAGRLPGRTDNEIKNYWNSHLRRKLVRNGIDPNNHKVNQTLTLQSRNRKPKEFEDSDSLNDGDSVSDAASCMEEDCSRGMPDLNLELTISLPSDCVAIEKQKNEVEGLKIEDTNSPTLVLFR